MTPDKATGYGQYNAGNYSNPEVDRLTLATPDHDRPKGARRGAEEDRAHPLRRRGADAAALAASLLGRAQECASIGTVVNVIDMPYLGDLVIE